MNPTDLLDVLLRAGATIGQARAGNVVAVGVPPALEPALAEHRADLAFALAGRDTGHRWATCTRCARTQLIATGTEQPCKLKPGCDGRLKVYAKARPTRPPLDLDGEPVPCARPRCDRPATHRTAWHEAVCTADFHHLALANITGGHPQP